MKTDTILNMIRMLSSQGASGSLQISTGMTGGAVSFDRGEIVEARLGKLRGFQAINALATVPDATYNFDQSITAPTENRITPSERLLLRDFFGIQPVEPQVSDIPLERWPEEDPMPVVPLSSLANNNQATAPSSVDDRLDEPSSIAQPYERIHDSYSNDLASIPEQDPEGTLVRRRTGDQEGRPPLFTQPMARSSFGPALLVILLIIGICVAAITLVRRFHKSELTASDGPTVQTSVQTASPGHELNSEEVTSDVPDLSGNWKVINTVEQTSYQAYQNMEIGFNVSINQDGKSFTGTGEKVSENGRSLAANSRTAIEVKGTIDGDRVEAMFFENGALRKTNGHFVWRIDKGRGGLTGTFVSNAARTSGRSTATKLS